MNPSSDGPRDSFSPIVSMIDASVACSRCGAKGVGNCDCWEKCSCGWMAEKGQPCGNPAKARCSSKVLYGRPTCVAEVWQGGVPDHQCTRAAWNVLRSGWGYHPLCRQHEKALQGGGQWIMCCHGDEFVKPHHLIREAS